MLFLRHSVVVVVEQLEQESPALRLFGIFLFGLIGGRFMPFILEYRPHALHR